MSAAATEWECARALADQLDQWGHTAAEARTLPSLVQSAGRQLDALGWYAPRQISDQLRDLTIALLVVREWDGEDDDLVAWRTDPLLAPDRPVDELLAEAQRWIAIQIARVGTVEWRHISPGETYALLTTAMRQIATARAALTGEVADDE